MVVFQHRPLLTLIAPIPTRRPAVHPLAIRHPVPEDSQGHARLEISDLPRQTVGFGRLDVLQRFHETHTALSEWDSGLLAEAALRKHVAVAWWLLTNRSKSCVRCDDTAVIRAAACNGTGVAGEARGRKTVQLVHPRSDGRGAAEQGHLEIVQYLHRHRPEGCSENAIIGAAKKNHLAVLRFLHETRRVVEAPSWLLNCVILRGHVDVVRYPPREDGTLDGRVSRTRRCSRTSARSGE